MRTKIIYEDKELLVCWKPSGLAVQTARVGEPDMASELKNYLKSPYLGVVHRLDQPVEGLLVFARTKKAAAGLSAQLGEGVLNKQYYAVIYGQPPAREGELVDYLYKSTDNRAVVATGQADAQGKGKKAVLQYKLLQNKLLQGAEKFSLVDIHLGTGRFHQIRAQMAHGGMPLLGDRKYGNEASLGLSSRLGADSVALCAYKLEFLHPITGRKLSFQEKPQGKTFSFFGIF